MTMQKDYETLKLEVRDEQVLLVTLNRPEASNALNTQMGRDLLDLFSGLVAAPEPYRCVVLTGAGEKAFCAGGDLKERRGMTQAAWQAQHAIFERMTLSIVDCPIPIIAAVNGAAYGGGTELVGAADFAYASANARFALTEVTLGIMPGAAGTQTLPRSVGPKRAKEIIFTGRPFSAAEAHAWGLVNRVTAPEALLPETIETALRISGNAPLSVRQAKKSVHYGMQMDLRTAMFFEIEAYNRLVDTEDRHEGVLAFNEKRKPVFKGR
jgi:enoyl-CoA hydratase/carnithine racemase